MCDKELLLGYLYGELQPAEHEAFDRHLASCPDCRSEVGGLRGARAHLASWTPPEPDLGFQIVRAAKPTASSARWRPAPVWGLAAAALLVLGVSAAIANLEVTVGSSGVTFRTGWHRGAAPAPNVVVSTASPAPNEVQRLEARLKTLEAQLVDRPAVSAAPVAAGGPGSRMSDADIMRLVRQLIDNSEQRQEGILASRMLQMNRDVELARRVDVDRMRAGLIQVQGTAAETSRQQRDLADLVRVGMQR
jgi:hypothetical protein